MAERLATRWRHGWTAAVLVGTMMAGSGCAQAPVLAGITPGQPVQTAARKAGSAHMQVPQRFQGDTSSCGPSSLWSVMGYHLGPGKVNFANLDKSLRPTGSMTNSVGTMPGALAEAAERYRLTASVTNNATTRHLRTMLDNGLPVIILGEWRDGSDRDLHFVVVNGYEGTTNADTTWIVTDSLVEDGTELRWSTKELMTFWDEVTLYGRLMPYHRATVNIAPKAKADLIPEDNRTAWVRFLDNVLKSGTDVLRWLDNRRQGEAPLGWVPPANLAR